MPELSKILDENAVLKHSIERLRARNQEQQELLERHVLEKRQLIEANAETLEKANKLGDIIREVIRLTDKKCFEENRGRPGNDGDTLNAIIVATEPVEVLDMLGLPESTTREWEYNEARKAKEQADASL